MKTILILLLLTSSLVAQESYATTVARRIYAKSGVVLQPAKYTWQQLIDYEKRIEKSEEIIRDFGIKLDPFQYSIEGLEDCRNRMVGVNVIKKTFGVSYEWSAYTNAELQSQYRMLATQFPERLAAYNAAKQQSAQPSVLSSMTEEQRQNYITNARNRELDNKATYQRSQDRSDAEMRQMELLNTLRSIEADRSREEYHNRILRSYK